MAPTDAISTATKSWNCIRRAESGDNYRNHSDEPQTGAYSILDTTWTGSYLHMTGEAWQYPKAVQDAAALKLYAWGLRYYGNGFEQWSTRFKCRLG